tara:strand:- start:108196 stop:108825 length:630 start_codon:yes stop_codon:yes gene_type:complete
MNITSTATGMALIALAAGTAMGSVTVSQGASAPTYSTTLNFDEVGGPTGVVATDSWAGIGLAVMQSGTGLGGVGDVSGVLPWINSGNAFEGAFGVFMNFDTDLTDFSAQVWDPSGPGSFIGGGMIAVAFDDGVEVGSFFSDAGPAWGGIGDEWWNISTTDGMVFDEVRILGFGFSPTTYIDNISWNAVPTPSSLAMLGLGGLVTTRRRR